ncbi:MAG: CCA tRNA nucleotidyltransferase [Muribaculaceae bacterium]|nr:CCA tRNA nucleotidyltransferase [Muribaculaceae bacterium]MDE6770175.1 CCA tRNA nucleotidyltransferase [Muribaculaceae bacterium]
MNLKEDLSHPIFKTIGEIADSLGREVYVVGGFVRDLFLRRHSKDYDFVTVGSGIELAEAVAAHLGHKAKLSVFPNYGTAQVKYRDLELEFVGARRESYTRDSRNPIVENGTLDDDMQRRDFTINAMAICLNKDRFGELVDPFNGLIDLHTGVIRTPLDPDITFSDDPLRMLRAIRFASQLYHVDNPGDSVMEYSEVVGKGRPFRIATETFDAIKKNAGRMEIITRERINDELSKIMRSPRPSVGWRLLDMSQLLPYVFPSLIPLKGVEMKEGRGHKDNFYHTIQVVDNVAQRSDNEWLRWAALLHDIAKPTTKKYDSRLGWTFHNHNFIGEKMVPRIFREMKLPLNEKMKYVAKLVGLHMRPQSVGEEGVSDSGVRRMITDAGSDVEDLMILAESDITSKQPEKVRRQLEGFTKLRERMHQIQDADAFRTWKNPIDGNEIMEKLGLPPGPEIAKLKDQVKEAIMDGRVPYDHDAAWEYLMANYNPNPSKN